MIISYKIKEKALKDLKSKWFNFGIILFIIASFALITNFVYNLLTFDKQIELAEISIAISEIDISTEAGFQKMEMYMQNLISIYTYILPFSLILFTGEILKGLFSVSKASLFLGVSKGQNFEKKDIKKLFSRLKEGILLELLASLYILLWSLLFIIPGLVKAVGYSMAPYIKAENPEMGYKECLVKSERLMEGFKWHYVTFLISFIGWYLLTGVANTLVESLIPAGSGLLGFTIYDILTVLVSIPLFVYVEMATVNYYVAIKEERKSYDEFMRNRQNGFNPFQNFSDNQSNQKPFESFDEQTSDEPFDSFSSKEESKKEENDPFSEF